MHSAGPAPGPAAAPVSLRRNAAWLMGSRIVYVLCQWLALVLIARYEGAAALGEFTLALAVTAPVFLFFNFELRAVLLTETRTDVPFGVYLGGRALGMLAAASAIGIYLLAGADHAGLLIAVTLFKLNESIGDLLHGLWLRAERAREAALWTMLRGIGYTLATAAGVAFGGVEQVAWGINLAWLVILLGMEWPRSRALDSLRVVIDRRTWRLLRRCTPVGIIMLLGSLQANVPVYFLAHHAGTAAVGYFNALMYVVIAGQIVPAALTQSASPRLAQLFAAGRKADYLRLVGRMMRLTALFGAVAMAFVLLAGGPALALVYGAEYAGLGSLFAWLLLAGLLTYASQFMNLTFTITRRFITQSWLMLAALIVLAVLCVLLIPASGLIGAAYALVISRVVYLLASGGWNRAVWRARGA